MSDNLNAQPGGHLFKLPDELRLLIYEYVFPPRKVDIHAPRPGEWIDDDDEIHVKNADVALLSTCRTVYAEAAPVLYENTEFFIRFACSSPDLHSTTAAEQQFYTELAQDMRGRVRSLLTQARYVSLSIYFGDISAWGAWEGLERRWFRQVTNELIRLGDAQKLKQLHVTFEADEKSRPALSGFPEMSRKINHVLGELSDFESCCHSCAVVTTAVHPSIGPTHIDLSFYFDALATKLSLTDTTEEVYSERLALLSARSSDLEQWIKDNRDFVASENPEYLAQLDFCRGFLSVPAADDLIQEQGNNTFVVDEALKEIVTWGWKNHFLRMEITKMESHLEWFAKQQQQQQERPQACGRGPGAQNL